MKVQNGFYSRCVRFWVCNNLFIIETLPKICSIVFCPFHLLQLFGRWVQLAASKTLMSSRSSESGIDVSYTVGETISSGSQSQHVSTASGTWQWFELVVWKFTCRYCVYHQSLYWENAQKSSQSIFFLSRWRVLLCILVRLLGHALWLTNLAMERPPCPNRWFTYGSWWCSIARFVAHAPLVSPSKLEPYNLHAVLPPSSRLN